MPGPQVKKEAPNLRSSSSRASAAGGGSSGSLKDDGKKSNIPGFLTKTFEIFSNEEFEDLCGWGENGDTIIIKKVPEFSSTVLPRYFKHSNFQSFVRQLNMYDFHKTVQDPSHGEFRHDYFRKGREDLLHKIKRKVSQPSSSSSHSSRPSGGSSHHHNKDTYSAAATMMTLPTQALSVGPSCGLSVLAESSTLKSRTPANKAGLLDTTGPAEWEGRVSELEGQVKSLQDTNASLWSQLAAQQAQMMTLRTSFTKAIGVIQELLGGTENPVLQEVKAELEASGLHQPTLPTRSFSQSSAMDESDGLNVLATSAEEAAAFNRVSSELWRGQSLTAIPSFSRFFSQDGAATDDATAQAATTGGAAVAGATPGGEFGVRMESLERAVEQQQQQQQLLPGAAPAVPDISNGYPAVASGYEQWPVDQRARKRGRISYEDAQAMMSQLSSLHRTSQATIHKIDSLEAQLSTLFEEGDYGLQPVGLADPAPSEVEGAHLVRQFSQSAAAAPLSLPSTTTTAEPPPADPPQAGEQPTMAAAAESTPAEAADMNVDDATAPQQQARALEGAPLVRQSGSSFQRRSNYV